MTRNTLARFYIAHALDAGSEVASLLFAALLTTTVAIVTLAAASGWHPLLTGALRLVGAASALSLLGMCALALSARWLAPSTWSPTEKPSERAR